MVQKIVSGLNLFLHNNNICLLINALPFKIGSVELYTVMPVIICEAFHDVHCFTLAKCNPQFCLDLADMIKSLSLKAILTFGQIKTM